MIEPICNLCKEKRADKFNSHIVPDFLTRSVFDLKKGNAFLIKKDGKSKPVQSTTTEDNIFCADCEKRIEVVETIFAQKIRDIHNYKNLPKKFEHIVSGRKEYLKCRDINPILFRLFIYSIIWRLSISNCFEFQTFKVSKSIEEQLRSFLNSNLANTHTLFNQCLSKITFAPDFHICLIKPKQRTFPPEGILTANSINSKLHLAMLVEFALVFINDDQTIHPAMVDYSNKGKNSLVIGLGDNELWLKFNDLLVSQMLHSGKNQKTS